MNPKDIAKLITEDPDILDESIVDLDRVYALIRAGKPLSEVIRILGISRSAFFHYIKKTGGWPLEIKEQIKANAQEQLAKKLEDPEYKAQISQLRKKRWQDPEFREKMTGISSSPEYREKLAKGLREKWQDPEYRKNIMKSKSSPEYKAEISAQMSEIIKNRWQDPEYREKMAEISSSPEYRAQASEKAKKRWAGHPEQREHISNVVKKKWEDPEFREKIAKIYSSPEFKEKMAKIYSSPEYRALMREKSKKYWENVDFWDWLSTKPIDKRIEIIVAMFHRGGTPTNDELRKMYLTIKKAINLGVPEAIRLGEPEDVEISNISRDIPEQQ